MCPGNSCSSFLDDSGQRWQIAESHSRTLLYDGNEFLGDCKTLVEGAAKMLRFTRAVREARRKTMPPNSGDVERREDQTQR